jgi:mycothiol system anti-sigma-R factor
MGDTDSNCNEAIHTLYEFLDGELTPQRQAEIRQHLEDCLPCFAAYDFEAELRNMVSTKCRDQAPLDLQQRISDKLRQMSQGLGGIPNL